MSSCKALISNFSREKDHLLIGGCFVKRVANYSLVLILLLLKPNSYNKVARDGSGGRGAFVRGACWGGHIFWGRVLIRGGVLI